MSGPIISADTGGFISSLKAISDLGGASEIGASELQSIEFSTLIDQQNTIPGLLTELKELLPEQDFSHIEAFVGGGNGLPLAADPGSESDQMPDDFPLPVATALAVARQQLAATQLAVKNPAPVVKLPLPQSGILAPLADSKPGMADPVSVAASSAALNVGTGAVASPAIGFSGQFLNADFDSTVGSRKSVLQESAPAVAVNPLSAFKSAEAALPMRSGSPTMLALETPLGARGWEQGVGDRIQWMLGNSVQGVSLRISPAHLGPIDIQLSVHQDQATVTFNAQHAVVREALEASIPRLREMFQENQLQLAQVDVGQRGNSGQQTAGGNARNGQDDSSLDTLERSDYDGADSSEPAVRHSAIDGLLNDYA